MSNISRHPTCEHRTELGNCLPIGGFCTAVPTSICEAERNKSMSKTREMIITQTLSDLGVQIDLKTAPLVRCKNCKAAESVNCPMWRAHFGYTDTDFCSMGVPKEEEHEHID